MSQQTLNPTEPSVSSSHADTATTDMANQSAVVAIYDTHIEAEAAIRDLQKLGFDMTKLSIVAKHYQTEEHVVGYYSIGDRMKVWGTMGAFWGGVWGLLFSSALFIVPGMGPLLAAGPIVLWTVSALEGAAVVSGLSALGAALVSVGIPTDSIVEYETQIKAGKFMVIAHGELDDLDKGMIALESVKHESVRQHALETAN